MATKSTARQPITQLTATGNSDVLDSLGGYFSPEAHIKHVNGTGTITAGATVAVRYRTVTSSGELYTLTTITFGTTASTTEYRYVELPEGAVDVRFDYTAPSGSTGHTLDADVTGGQIS